MKAILLAGIPGTGKTTIAKKLIMETGGFSAFEKQEPEQLVNCVVNGNFFIVGKYDDSDEVFQGTDKLSMAVSPNFQKWVSEKKPQQLFIEGDRLVGNKTIDFLIESGYDTKVIVVTVSDKTRLQRYKDRGSEQPESFIKSKMTKVGNILSRLDLLMDGSLEEMPNEDQGDLEKIVSSIKEHLVL